MADLPTRFDVGIQFPDNTIQTTAATGGVSSVNTLTGALTIAAGTGIAVTDVGSTITVSAASAILAYYQGYHAPSAFWSTSSLTYADPTITGVATLVQRQASGVTVSTAPGSILGITFTPASSTAVYLIIAEYGIEGDTGSAYVDSQLVSGSTVIAQAPSSEQPATSPTKFYAISLSGIFVPGTTSPVTVKLQLATNVGTAEISQGNLSNPVEWTIVQIVPSIGGGGGVSVNMAYGLTTPYVAGANSVIIFDTKQFDSHNEYSTITGLYTVPISGEYRFSVILASSSSFNAYLVKNGTGVTFLTVGGNLYGTGSVTISCVAGDTLAVYTVNPTTFDGPSPYNICSLNIERIGN